jgi:hypothetical protein
MAKPLVTASLVAPAFLGLNTQESSVANDPRFALEANNCVIDEFGRLGARKGWIYRTTSGGTGTNLLGMHPFLDITGVNTLVSWSADTFYTGLTTLTERTPTTTDTIAAGNWQGVTLNDRAYFFQRGYKPLYYTNETTPNEFKSIDQHADYDGTAPLANIVLSAYGRLWAADTTTNKTTVYFSDLLDGARWGSGSAGSLNISGVLPKGSDVITGLAAHNGFLFILCKDNIIIFQDQDSFQGSFDVNTLRLVEVIKGVGCIARDSIQNTGTDVAFLSATGLRSLGRTIQEKSAPMNDLTKNVRDTFMDIVNREANLDLVKSCYFPDEAIYIISLPEAKTQFVFDTRTTLEDASLRCTTWNSLDHTDYVYDATNKAMYLTQVDGIAEYIGYQDNGSGYSMAYFTNHFDLGAANVNKMLKKAAITAIGSSGQDFSLKVGYDYNTSYFSTPFTLKQLTVSEYGIAEYGANAATVAEYNLGVSLDRLAASVSGSGDIVQIGIETHIDGAPLSVQKLDVYAKQGRII